MKKLLLFLTTMILWSFSLYSVDVQIGSGTATTVFFPIYSRYNYSYSQQIYLQSEIQDAGGGAGDINKIRFHYKSGGVLLANSANWTIYMGNTGKSVFSSTTDWIPTSEMTQVFSGVIPQASTENWIEITLPAPFNYTGGNLVIAVDENDTGNSGSPAAAWYSFDAGTNRGIMYYNNTTNPNPAFPPPASIFPTAQIAQVQFNIDVAVCSGTPNPGNTISSAPSVCPGVNFTLSFENIIPGGGLTYRWQSSPNGNEPWANLGTEKTQTTSQTSSKYYRCKVTCTHSGLSAFSTPLLVPVIVTSVPFEEGFITPATPSCWDINGWTIGSIRGVTGNPGYNIYKNIYHYANPGASFKTCMIGPVNTGMALTFDYKVANYLSPYAPPAIGSGNFIVSILDNERASFNNLDTVVNNGIAGWQTKLYLLENYVGENIMIKFTCNWELGDWDIAFDNIKIAEAPVCIPPINLTATNITATNATIGWTPIGTETSWNLKYGEKGFIPETQGTLVENILVNNCTISGLNDNTQYDVYVRADCGEIVSSWAEPVTFSTLCVPISVFPWIESFGPNFPTCWSYSEGVPGGNNHWAITTYDGIHGVSGPQSGTHFIYLNCHSFSSYYNPYYLTSPTFNLGSTPKQVKYYYYLGANGYQSFPFPLTFQISIDNGETWTDLYAHNNTNSIFATNNSVSWWTQNTIDLSTYVNKTVIFRFEANSNWGSNYCNQGIDEFVVADVPSCPPPTALNVSEITSNNAKISWTPGDVETTWNLLYGDSGFNPETQGTLKENIASNPYLLEELEENTQYDIYVQAICSEEDVSPWSAKKIFKTLCGSFNLPYIQDFDDVAAPAIPDCITITNNNGDTKLWCTSTSYPKSSPNSMCIFNNNILAMNDWFFTPGLILTGGVVYRVEFYYRSFGNDSPEKLEVKWGSAPNATEMTGGRIWFNDNIINSTYALAIADFIPEENGIYYVGWHGYSDANNVFLCVDDILIDNAPVCSPPTDLIVTNITPTSTKISWTPGDVETTWNLLYGDSGFNPETQGTLKENIASNPYLLEELEENTQYDIYVQAVCGYGNVSAWSLKETFRTLCKPANLPYIQNFDSVSVPVIPDCMTVINDNGDDMLWETYTLYYNSAPNCMGIQFNFKLDMDDWFYTPALNLTGDTTYLVEFYYRCHSANFPEKLEVKCGTDIKAVSMSGRQIWNNDNITNTNYVLATAAFTPEEDGTYYVGWHGYSAKNMYYLYVDDIIIEKMVPGSLAGNVSDILGPIEGARIFSDDFEAFTDENGNYLIENILPGIYDISCEAETFFTKHIKGFRLKKGSNTLNFVLDFAQITIEPESFEEGLLSGTQKTKILNISNPNGTGPLTWSASISYQSDKSSGLIQPFTYGKIVETNNADKNKDACETTTIVSGMQPKETWEILQSFYVSAGNEQGIVTDGEYIYTAFWNTAGKFGKYTLEGEFIETYTIANVGGIRDLTYDGEYFYGGAASNTIYKLDLANKTLEGTITSSVVVRHISYDPIHDAFWCGDWNSLRLISRTGSTIIFGPILASVYGSAYDGYSEGGPFLWLFAQKPVEGYGTTNDKVMIQQFNIATNSITGVFHCAIDIPGYITGSIAGGIFATDLLIPNKYVLMVNIQQTPNLIGVYELKNLFNWLNLSSYEGVVPPINDQDIDVMFNSIDLKEGTYHATIQITHDGQSITKGMLQIPVTMNVVVGCAVPKKLTVSDITATNAKISWTKGDNETKWNLKYGHSGFDPTNENEGTLVPNIQTNSHIISGLNASTLYDVYVQAVCGEEDVSEWSAKRTFKTLCGTVNLPYYQNFDSVTAPAIPDCMTITNDNGDAYSWETSTLNSKSVPNSIIIRWNANLAMDDWFFTPELNLIGGKTYLVEFYYRSSLAFKEKLEVKWGTAPNAAGMTGGQIWVNENIQSLNYTLATADKFTPELTGVYYVGWHGYSEANKYLICVDDISITQVEEPGPPLNPTYSGRLVKNCYDALGVMTIQNAEVKEGTNTELRAEVNIVAINFTVESNAEAYLYAGYNINLENGVHLAQGANFLAAIMDEITYCTMEETMVTVRSEGITLPAIKPAEMDAMFTIFPNPTTGRFTLLMKETDDTSVVSVEVFGLMGERVLQTQLFGQNRYEFDLSGSPKGVYIVRVLSGKQTSIEKLIKQ